MVEQPASLNRMYVDLMRTYKVGVDISFGSIPHCMAMADAVGCDGQVFAFEINGVARERARSLIRSTRDPYAVEVYPYDLGATPLHWTHNRPVHRETLDRILEGYPGVDVIRIGPQSDALAVLTGSIRILQRSTAWVLLSEQVGDRLLETDAWLAAHGVARVAKWAIAGESLLAYRKPL